MVYPRDPITGLFNAKRFQFGLNLQASVDGQHLLNWGFDDWYLTGCRDIEWGKDLGTLLYNEVTLWGDLVSCEGCRIYKPQEAFDHFEFERNFLSKAKVQRQVHTLEPEDIAWYKSHCKRCRVRILLVFLDSRVEMLDEQELGLHTRTSLGVLYKTPRTEFERKQEMEAARGLGPEEYHAAECGYETWSQIFEKLKI
ncbi:hypothetical protein GLAREA_10218 [Glarea lozoyensis ATCC 20868]|uniref:Uncharacterized protein n=1 Tax=Glarea lozoyensis (strain ATCC 20868 / MF5171) TaxID=1116229 RepID=S3DBN5_GLAL2|nr:uncharacterized protein GLAREA_10218 [Glarea lozoyensis ATCC 20868]EPE34524.1 hypothetical protein GLAREA_10218 [Glarea lozoyensis ATCC 20868]